MHYAVILHRYSFNDGTASDSVGSTDTAVTVSTIKNTVLLKGKAEILRGQVVLTPTATGTGTFENEHLCIYLRFVIIAKG